MRSREEINRITDSVFKCVWDMLQTGWVEEDIRDSIRAGIEEALSPSPVPVEELRAGKYRMTVDVEIQSSGHGLQYENLFVTFNGHWIGDVVPLMVNDGATFHKPEVS